MDLLQAFCCADFKLINIAGFKETICVIETFFIDMLATNLTRQS